MPGVTLLGDAAHLTAPSGEGANLALFDGAELAKAIAAHPDSLELAQLEYEQAMFPRSEVAAAESHQLRAHIFGDRAPHGFLQVLKGELQDVRD